MTACSFNTYYIFYTDKNKGAIAIPRSAYDQDTLDIILLGKTRAEYGETFNENLLHLLENFASNGLSDGTPDYTKSFSNLLEQPVVGQIWFNNTTKDCYVCTNSEYRTWKRVTSSMHIAGNSGFLSHGEYIPLPVARNGYEFTQQECVWNVSPSFINTFANNMYGYEIDSTDRLITAEYNTDLGTSYGMVNYIIIGFKDSSTDEINVECAVQYVTPTPSVTPTITPTPTVSVTPSVSVSVTPSITPTISTTATPTVTPTRSPTPTPTVGVTVTPTITPTITPTVTPSVTPEIPLMLGDIPTSYSGTDDSTNMEMYITFFNDGTWQSYDPDTGTASGSWLEYGIASDYELAAEYTDGYPEVLEGEQIGSEYRYFEIINVDTSENLDKSVYHRLDENIKISAYDSVFAPDPTYNGARITIYVRKISDYSVNETIQITCNLDGGCFAVGTQVQMSNGRFKNIENIKAGDSIRSFNVDTMKDESTPKWSDWSIGTIDSLQYKVSKVKKVKTFTADSSVTINNFTTTPKHIYLVYSNTSYQWKHANEVQLTDKLVKSNGDIIDIFNISTHTGQMQFVLLDVEVYDTLIVKTDSTAILVHNASA